MAEHDSGCIPVERTSTDRTYVKIIQWHVVESATRIIQATVSEKEVRRSELSSPVTVLLGFLLSVAVLSDQTTVASQDYTGVLTVSVALTAVVIAVGVWEVQRKRHPVIRLLLGS